MASKFILPDRNSPFLEFVSYQEVLGIDHLVWTVIDVVDGLDLSTLYDRFLPDVGQGGRPAFDPKMLVVLLVYGYSEGKTSSRGLERACVDEWPYRAICGGLRPDHATIARFRESLDDVLEDLFTQVLMACHDEGLIDVSVVALDGTKMRSVASKEANRTDKKLIEMGIEARRLLDAGAQADTELQDSNATTEPESEVLTETTNEPEPVAETEPVPESEPEVVPVPVGRVSSVSRRVTDKVGRAERIVEALQVATSVVDVPGKKPKSRVGNVTDPEARLQKTRDGFVQGFNAQAVVSGDQIVIACHVTSGGTDVQELVPLIEASQRNVATAGVTELIDITLADAGYWSQANAEMEESLGVNLLIATGKTHAVGTHDPELVSERDRQRIELLKRVEAGDCTLTEAAVMIGKSVGWLSVLRKRFRDHGDLRSDKTIARNAMALKLSEPDNKELYKKRGWLIEGNFAQIKWNRGITRFKRHGLTACDAEWKLINLAGNIQKLHKKRTTGASNTSQQRVIQHSRCQKPQNRQHRSEIRTHHK